MAGEPATLRVDAEAILFGFPSTKAVLTVRPRDASWRMGGAAATMAGFTVAAGVVAVVPPHAPWLLGALGTGVFLARRRWTERYTLERVSGTCPKCGGTFRVKRGRLRTPHPVSCERCHFESSLMIPTGALPA